MPCVLANLMRVLCLILLQGPAWGADRLQRALGSASQRMAALLGLSSWQGLERVQQAQPQQQQAAFLAEPVGASSWGGPSARRLAQSSGLVPVALLPAADNGTVVVDGYSGLPRALNSSQQLPPVCGADGAPPTGYPADAACLGSLVLRTAGTQVDLLLSLGGDAAFPAVLPTGDVFSIVGNASLIGVTRGAGACVCRPALHGLACSRNAGASLRRRRCLPSLCFCCKDGARLSLSGRARRRSPRPLNVASSPAQTRCPGLQMGAP